MTKSSKISKTQRVVRSRSLDTRVVRIRTENNGLGYVKTVIVVVALALQFAAMIALYMFVASIFRWYVALSFALSLISCIKVLSSNKNGQSKAAWVLFLLLGFSVGYIIYYLSDVRVFFGKAQKRYKKIYEKTEKYKKENAEVRSENGTEEIRRYLDDAGGFRTFTGTRQKYFPSGTQLFDDVIERLKSAEKFIFIEFYIIADGILLKRILNILEKKAKDGVDIRIIYDDLGSHRAFKRRTRKRIRAAGIKLETYNRLTPRFTVALNYRDHRKIIVVDGKTAYTGGNNLADEYINEKRMHGYWKDSGLRLDGPAVDAFTLMFLRQWEFVTKTEQDYEKYLNLAESADGVSAAVVPYADGLDYECNIGKDVYVSLISSAKERLWAMTPYLVPDDTVMNLLANKARSGVDVRIILPQIPDKGYVYLVSCGNAVRLAAAGVKIYYMKNSFVHSKLMMNEAGAVIGSINLDLRSFYQQFECAVFTDDKQVLKQLTDDFNETMEVSAEHTQKKVGFFKRVLTGLLRIIEPLM